MRFLNDKEQQDIAIVILGESKTIPDTSVSIKDIVNKYTTQSYDELMRIGMYDEEVNLTGLSDEQIFNQLSPLLGLENLEDYDDISLIRKRLNIGSAQIHTINNVLKNKQNVQVQEKAEPSNE